MLPVTCPASTMFLSSLHSGVMLPVQPYLFLPASTVQPSRSPGLPCSSLCDVACSSRHCPASTVFLPVTLWCCLSSLYHVLPGHSVMLPVQPLPVDVACPGNIYHVLPGHSVMLDRQHHRVTAWTCRLPGPFCDVACPASTVFNIRVPVPVTGLWCLASCPASTRVTCDVACSTILPVTVSIHVFPDVACLQPRNTVMLPVLPCSR